MPAPARSAVPAIRIAAANRAPVRGDGGFVLYWMIAARRTGWNFGLQRAIEWCHELRRPLLVLEALRVAYHHASDRMHAFAIDGMAENAAAFAKAGVRHLPYVEPSAGAGKGLLEALAAHACIVITDDSPHFFLPRMVSAAADRLPVLLETVDSNGLLPLRAAPKAFTAAVHFRRFFQRELSEHLDAFPVANPLRGYDLGHATVPREIVRRWPAASAALLRRDPAALAKLPIDHTVPPVYLRGGAAAGAKVMRGFVRERLSRYSEEHSEPESDASSGLSPWLHWGFLSAHQVFDAVARHERWSPARVALRPTGAREGWWGMGKDAESFLDELITWRELSFNGAARIDGHDRYDTLPSWALATLERHADDPRLLISLEDLENGRTPDPLWNAAQGQLRREGRIHNYLRMLWGKRFLEWTRHPREAAEWMLHLNDRWALDGRDPNSISGVFWCLGRYDRPWGPERPIFGTVRYMSSANTARKLRVKDYVARYTIPDGDTRIAKL